MAESDLQQFLEKVRQLNAFVALSEGDPGLREALRACGHHDEVVALARIHGFEIGRRWGEPAGSGPSPDLSRQAPRGGLLSGVAPEPGEEKVAVLLSSGNLRLERIHSCGARSAPGFWYDQPEHEWVCLLQGSASLEFADEPGTRDLGTGDSLLIRAHRRHRVVATDSFPGTIWLALFWKDPAAR